MAPPVTQTRLSEEDRARAKRAIDAGLAKDMTDAIRQGLALLDERVRRTIAASKRSRGCRFCGRTTMAPCGVCDRHSVVTKAGPVPHGTDHAAANCPFKSVAVATRSRVR